MSGPGTRKSRNLVENPSCAIAVSLPGIDLVFEGLPERVTDDETLQQLAKRYGETGWPAKVEDGAFTYDYSAPSAGPPPWHLYELRADCGLRRPGIRARRRDPLALLRLTRAPDHQRLDAIPSGQPSGGMLWLIRKRLSGS